MREARDGTPLPSQSTRQRDCSEAVIRDSGRVVILGEAPARPRPGGSSQAGEGPLGGRTGRFLRSLTGDLDYAAFEARWEPLNLLREWPGRPPGGGKGSYLPPEAAFRSLEGIWTRLDGRVLVTLGARVRSLVLRLWAPEAPVPAWFAWSSRPEGQKGPAAWAAIPHPSGLSRVWNSRRAREEGARTLEEARNRARAGSGFPLDDRRRAETGF